MFCILPQSEHFKGSNIDMQQVLAFFKILTSHVSTISKELNEFQMSLFGELEK
jgi:hypothetical protein